MYGCLQNDTIFMIVRILHPGKFAIMLRTFRVNLKILYADGCYGFSCLFFGQFCGIHA